MAKNLKSPNRYGGVTKLSNASRRRRPYAVRITTGYVINEKTGKATQKYAIIGYAKTRNEGLQMLAKYHEHPFNIETGDMTFREVYENWSEDKYENAASMYKDGVISQEDYDDILAQLKTAQNAYKSAMRQLEKAGAETKILSKTPQVIKKVYAPADGEISKTLLEKGAKTTSGQDMILLTLNAMKVTAYVDKDTTFKLERGQNVLIKVPEYKNRMYNGSIEYIGQKSVNNAEAKDKYPVFINFDSNINSSAFQASKNASVYFLNNKRSVF